MDQLKQRFPDDLAYEVFWDSTVFVTSTVDEVVRTLVIAFVLVAIVVFLFLGKLRTTLIPLVAVPVSIIGTFAVMLLIGYSANTVSLLALVLAIGIVVDDAIVVIENVERVIEEEPELRFRRRPRRRWPRSPAPIIAITLVLLSVFVPVAFIPGISGQLFRQFAVAVSTAMLISAVNALTLSPALCAVLLKRGAARDAGRCSYVLGAIDRVRDGYVSIVRRLVRVAVFGLVAVAGVAAASLRGVQDDPAGLPAGGGPGRVLCRHAAARGRLAQPHRRSWSRRSRTSSDRSPACRACCRWSASISSTMSLSSNSAFFVVRLKPYEERTDRRRASTRSSPACGRSSPPSRAPSSFRSTCRRSSGSATPAGSSTCSRRCRARRRPTSRP